MARKKLFKEKQFGLDHTAHSSKRRTVSVNQPFSCLHLFDRQNINRL